jgi:hypothetical protein
MELSAAPAAKHQRLTRFEGPVLNAAEKLLLAVLRQL